MGRRPLSRPASSMRCTTSAACATVATKGSDTDWYCAPSNWVSRLWPSVSAVTPVWSETKNTLRLLTPVRLHRFRPTGAAGSVPCAEIVDNTPLRLPGKNALSEYVLSFAAVGLRDIERVGGKNASIGEMLGALTQLGVRVPRGFATTAEAFREFLRQGGLEGRINAELDALDSAD